MKTRPVVVRSFLLLLLLTAQSITQADQTPTQETAPAASPATAENKAAASSEKKDAAPKTEAPKAESAAEEEDIVTLSPFIVRSAEEKGYTNVNSLAGSRVGLALEDTPASVSVLTSQDILDFGITDMNSAIGFFGNIESNDSLAGANPFQDYNVSIRGLGSSNGFAGDAPPTRNYFNIHFNFDAYNTERIEFTRGPSSFFSAGNSQAFGGVNTSTKVAVMTSSFENFRFRTTSFGGARVTADFNRFLIKNKLAVRLNLLWDDQDGWQEFERYKKEGLHLAVTYRPFTSTEIRAEVEYGKNDRYLPFRVNDRFSTWNGITSNYTGTGTLPAVSTANGTARISSNVTAAWTYNPADSTSTLLNYAGFLQTVGTGRQVVGADFVDTAENLFPITRSASNNSAVTLPSAETSLMQYTYPASNPVRAAALYLNHQFTKDLGVEFAGAFFSQRRDVPQGVNLLGDSYRIDMNNFLPGGAPNPRVGQLYVQGRVEDQSQGNQYYYGRFQASWRHDWRLLKARLLTGVNYQWEDFFSYNYRYVRDDGVTQFATTNALANNNNTTIFVRRYLNERQIPFEFPSGPGIRRIRNAVTNNHSFAWNYQTAFTGSWLRSEKLKTLAAIRFDERYTASTDTFTADPRNDFNVEAKTAPARSNDPYSTSYNWGALYNIAKRTSVYINYSQQVPDPDVTATDLFGRPLPGRQREGGEYGIKSTFWNGKVGFSLGHYTNKVANSPTTELSGAAGGDVDEAIERIAANAGANVTIPATYSDVRTFQVEGWEIDLTANLNKNISLRLNAGTVDSSVEDEFSLTRNYVAANRDAWVAGATANSTTALAAVQTDLAAIDTAISNFAPGRPLRGVTDYSGSGSLTYRFTEGAAKGLSATATVNFRGERTIANYPTGFILPGGAVATPNDFYTFDPYEMYDLSLNYSRKIYGKDMSFLFRVENILNTRLLIPTGSTLIRVDANGRASTTGAFVVPTTFNYTPPTRFVLEAAIKF